ncbi:MAG TPA: hypothetical protein VK942_05880, partial [Actinomycetes bacterium]|nr:hypothetical protein [Actinomycetes bacterium]
KAITYLSLAGEQALSGAAYREAALFFADALALDQPVAPGGGSREDRLRRARWERQLGEAYLGLGRTGDGRIHLSRALELLGVPLPTAKRQLTGGLLQQLAIQAAHRALPAAAVRRQGRGREEALEVSPGIPAGRRAGVKIGAGCPPTPALLWDVSPQVSLAPGP